MMKDKLDCYSYNNKELNRYSDYLYLHAKFSVLSDMVYSIEQYQSLTPDELQLIQGIRNKIVTAQHEFYKKLKEESRTLGKVEKDSQITFAQGVED